MFYLKMSGVGELIVVKSIWGAFAEDPDSSPNTQQELTSSKSREFNPLF